MKWFNAVRSLRWLRSTADRQNWKRRQCTLHSLGLRPGDDVVVAMSGGVDSSVTLRLLADLDLNLSAVFMRNWLPEQSETPLESHSAERRTPEACEWEKDYQDVQRVCRHVGGAGFKVDMLDLSNDYWLRVFEPAVEAWDRGGTPNPDVSCNSEIKFGALIDRLPSKAHFLATGHYAHVERYRGRTKLLRCADANKDQTYYLSSVNELQLSRAVFPLATFTKDEVRALATRYGLHTADRAESMGVCFIGERGRFGDFVSQYISSDVKGNLVGPDGTLLGQHAGNWHYTIGQRARLAGRPDRWYVARKGVGLSGNDILVVPGGDHPALQCEEVQVAPGAFNWIWSDHPPTDCRSALGQKVRIQIRHRMRPVTGTVTVDLTGCVIIKFDTPVAAVSPGQVAAVWEGNWCLGSGIIDSTRCMDT